MSKHICHCCRKEYDCGKDCTGPDDFPCDACLSKMNVEDNAIQRLPKEAREAINKTIKEVQFRLSAAWPDGFTKHNVRFITDGQFAVSVLLTKEDKK